MSASLTPEQSELQARARALAAEHIAPRAAHWDRTEEYPWENVERLAQAGFMGMTIPAEFGGPGRSLLDALLVVEEMAKVCGITGRIVVEGNMGAIGLLMRHGSEALKRRCAPWVLQGDKPAVCIPELEAGSDATAIQITSDALQVFGARGCSRDFPLERMARDARMFTIGGGTAQTLRNVIGDAIMGAKVSQRKEG